MAVVVMCAAIGRKIIFEIFLTNRELGNELSKFFVSFADGKIRSFDHHYVHVLVLV